MEVKAEKENKWNYGGGVGGPVRAVEEEQLTSLLVFDLQREREQSASVWERSTVGPSRPPSPRVCPVNNVSIGVVVRDVCRRPDITLLLRRDSSETQSRILKSAKALGGTKFLWIGGFPPGDDVIQPFQTCTTTRKCSDVADFKVFYGLRDVPASKCTVNRKS